MGHWWQIEPERAQNKFTSVGAMHPSAAMAMTANRPDVPFSLGDVGHWFSSPHAEQMM